MLFCTTTGPQTPVLFGCKLSFSKLSKSLSRTIKIWNAHLLDALLSCTHVLEKFSIPFSRFGTYASQEWHFLLDPQCLVSDISITRGKIKRRKRKERGEWSRVKAWGEGAGNSLKGGLPSLYIYICWEIIVSPNALYFGKIRYGVR